MQSVSIKRSTSYNALGAAVPLLVTLGTLPVFLRTIGEARYGVLAILWTFLGYFGLFDLGTGRAVANRIAGLADATPLEREQVVWTALLLNLVAGVTGAGLLWLAAKLVLRLINIPADLVDEVRDALPLMVLAFPLLLTTGVLSGALQGQERFGTTSLITVIGATLAQLMPLFVALRASVALPALVASVLLARLFVTGALFAGCVNLLPLRLRPRPSSALAKPLLCYGGWITVTNIVAPLLTTLDRTIIGAVAGVQAVAYYAVPFNLATRVTIVPGSLSTVLFSRFSRQHGDASAEELLFISTKLLILGTTPLIVVGLLIMEPFLYLWIGPEFAVKAAVTGELLVLGLWANCFAYPAYAKIPASGRPDLIAKLQICETIPYFALLYVALSRFGVAGAAGAWAIRNTVDAAMLLVLSRVDREIWRYIVESLGFVTAGLAIAIFMPASTWVSTSAGVGLVAVMAAWLWSHSVWHTQRSTRSLVAQ